MLNIAICGRLARERRELHGVVPEGQGLTGWDTKCRGHFGFQRLYEVGYEVMYTYVKHTLGIIQYQHTFSCLFISHLAPGTPPRRC